MNYFDTARTNMVKNQLMTNQVNSENILQAFQDVLRHEFIKGDWQKVSYSDARIPMTDNRSMLSPDVLARMIQALGLHSTSKVLDVGCGTGYSSVILSKLCNKVVGVESNSILAADAANYVARNNIDNISIKLGEYFAGSTEDAPYDAILVNGAVRSVPKSLLNQLATGGRLICIVRDNLSYSKITLYENSRNTIAHLDLFDGFGDYL